jgi:hypothetical protein
MAIVRGRMRQGDLRHADMMQTARFRPLLMQSDALGRLLHDLVECRW